MWVSTCYQRLWMRSRRRHGALPLAATPSRERRRHPGRQHLPDNLPRVEEIVRCAEQTCRQCGAETAVIDYDESEQLDVEPARIRNHKC